MMTVRQRHRQPVPDRARIRAIRAYATLHGVSYSVAARVLAGAMDLQPLASQGRTVYPAGTDEHRQWLLADRERWSFDLRVRDTRRAATVPLGRAEHLAERFPPTRGEPGTGVGPLYQGESRQVALAMLYTVVAHEQPHLVPSVGELAWVAELGEETAVDIACAGMDRATRMLLDEDRWRMWTRVEEALIAGERSAERSVRGSALGLWAELHAASLRTSLDGARQILDALLVVGDDGHAPGTRVRVLAPPHRGRAATITGAFWPATGAPHLYEVRLDAVATSVVLEPSVLALNTDQATRTSVTT